MSMWKAEREREWLLERGITFGHAQTFVDCPSKGGMAESHISWIAMAHLVGLGNTMIDLAPRAIDGIDQAIASNEVIGPDSLAYYALLLEAKALAQWFLTGQNPIATWSEAFDARLATQRRYADEVLTTRDRNSLLDDVLAVAFQAGRYAEGIAFHDKLAGPMQIAAQRIKSPRQLAHALCQRAMGHSPGSDEALVRAGHQVLRDHLAERWLHHGQYLRSAMWLKIVHGLANPGLTPTEVMLKAYDDMPTVPRPDFLSGI